MIPALSAFESLPRFRWSSKQSFFACCPVHDEKTGSLRGTVKEDKLVVHCFGCRAPTQGIITALGLKWSDMFEGDGGASYAKRPARKRDYSFEQWRERELVATATVLRERDAILNLDWHGYDGPEFWEALGATCRDYGALEGRFETLRCGTKEECEKLKKAIDIALPLA